MSCSALSLSQRIWTTCLRATVCTCAPQLSCADRADELSQGLMADQDTDDSRVGGGTGGGYSGPVPGFEHPPATGLSSADAGGGSHSRAASSHVPSQVRSCVDAQAARSACKQTMLLQRIHCSMSHVGPLRHGVRGRGKDSSSVCPVPLTYRRRALLHTLSWSLVMV